MSVDNAKKFLKKLASDDAYRAEFEKASAADKKAKAKAAGFTFTHSELVKAAHSFTSSGGGGKVSDADLEKVAGGNTAEWVGVSVAAAALGA